MSIPKETEKLFVSKYISVGPNKFYDFIVSYSKSRIETDLKSGISPEKELLQYYDKFLLLFRKNGDNVHIEIASLFRKAAHCVYREMLVKGLTKRNDKFLNVVE